MSLTIDTPPAPEPDTAGLPDLGALGPVLDRYAAVLDDLIGFDPTVLSDAGVEYAIQSVVTQARRSAAGRNGLVLEALMRALPGGRRFRSPGDVPA